MWETITSYNYIYCYRRRNGTSVIVCSCISWRCAPFVAEELPFMSEAWELHPLCNPSWSKEATKWVRITGVYVSLSSIRWCGFDPCCFLEVCTSEMSQNHIALWPLECECAVNSNKQILKVNIGLIFIYES
jgi:hypothetical protein